MKRKIINLVVFCFFCLLTLTNKTFPAEKKENISSLENLYLQAQGLNEQKKYAEAEKKLFQILNKFPQNYLQNEIMLALGLCYLAQGKSNQAENIFKALIRYNPAYKELEVVRFNLGLISYRRKDFSAALNYFSGIKNKEALFYSAQCFNQLGQGMTAVSRYQELIENHSSEINTSGDLHLLESAERGIAESFYQMGKYDLAIEKLNYFVNRYPQSNLKSYIHYLLGLCYFQKNDFAQAINYFQLVVNSNDKELMPIAQYYWAESLYQSKKTDEAVNLFQQIASGAKKESIGIEADYRLVSIYALTGEYPQAIRLCERESFSEDRFTLLKGICYSQQKEFAKARKVYRYLIERSPDTKIIAVALYLIAKSYFTEGDYIQLVTYYQNHFKSVMERITFKDAAEIWKEKALLYIADGYYQLKQYEAAKLLYQEIFKRKLNPEISALALSGLEVLDVHLGDFDQSTKKLNILREDYKFKLNSEAAATIDLETANLYFNQKDWDKAVVYYYNFSETYPREPRIDKSLYQTGLCFTRLGYYSEALSTWEKLSTNLPSSLRAGDSLNKASATAFGLGDYQKAINISQQLIERYPQSPLVAEAYLRIAQSYYNGKNYEKAIVGYQEFLNKFPAHSLLAEVEEGMRLSYLHLSRSGKLAELENYIQKYKGTKFCGELYWQAGMKAYELKDFVKAIEYFQEIVANYSTAPSAKQGLFYLAESYYLKGDLPLAITTYQNFLDSFSQDELVSAVKFHLANAHFQLNQLENSLDIYKQIIAADPQSDYAKNSLLNSALTYENLNKYEQALETYLAFKNKYPEDEKLTFVFVQMAKLNEKIENYPQAIEYYQKIKPGPEISVAELNFHLSNCYRNIGQIEKAIEHYQYLRQAGNSNDYFWLNGLVCLAEIYEHQNNPGKAVEIYNELIDKVKDKNLQQTFLAKKEELSKIGQ